VQEHCYCVFVLYAYPEFLYLALFASVSGAFTSHRVVSTQICSRDRIVSVSAPADWCFRVFNPKRAREAESLAGQNEVLGQESKAWQVCSMYCVLQIRARCPLFSSLKRTRDHVHAHTVAKAPSRLTRALRNPHTTAQNVLGPTSASHPGIRWYALRSLSSVSLSAALCRRMAAGEQYATSG